MDDGALMEQVSRGDREAFAMLVEQYAPALQRFAVRLLVQQPHAEEVVQETLARAWLKAAEYDAERARLSTWLYRIAHNLCVDRLRRQEREVPLAPALESALTARDTAEHLMETLDSQNRVARAIASLSERHRTALVLTYYQSLSNREVAEIMGLSLRALESLLVRARQQIKTTLEASS
jgi:RNA polymerase sigma-70 factor (ECF subfamily)